MPYRSAKQRRYVNMLADQGVEWAKKFKRDSDAHPLEKAQRKRRRRGK